MTRLPNPRLTRCLVDAVVVTTGWAVALVATNITTVATRSTGRSAAMVVVATMVTLAVMKQRGLYAGRPTLPRTDEISRALTSTLAGASAIAVTAAFLDWHIGAWEIVLGWTLVFSARMLTRGLSRAVAIEFPDMWRPETVVIVGTGHEARELADLITDHPDSSMTLAGVIGNLSIAERSGLVDRWIGPPERLIELMNQHHATGAIVTTTGFRGTRFRTLTRQLFQAGYDVHLTTGVSRMGEGRFEVRSLCHEPLVVMQHSPLGHRHYWVKRVIDVLGASIVLVLTAPVMLLTSLLIVAEDRGPIFYTAARMGRRGRLFSMYKFRSMVTNAESLKAQMQDSNERSGPLFKISNDPRITRVGRFVRETSIDELPQLINVLRGDMSLVGPRPVLPEEEAEFDDELRDRFAVRPGITGLWQVEARSNAAFNAYRRLDLHYVENWSLGLDLRILLATAEQVLITLALLPLKAFRRSGHHSDGIVTSPQVADLQYPVAASAGAGPSLHGLEGGDGLAPLPQPIERGDEPADDVVIDLRTASRGSLAASGPRSTAERSEG